MPYYSIIGSKVHKKFDRVVCRAVPCRAPTIHKKKTLFLDAPQHLYNCVCPSVRRSFPPSQLAKSTKSRNNTTSKQPRLNDKSGNKQNSISIIIVIIIIVIIVVVKATLSSCRCHVIVIKYN